MPNRLLSVFVLIFWLSCNDDDGDAHIRQEEGKIWLSVGLLHCAEQIHLDNGDTLIVNIEDIMPFISGDRVSVSYREIGIKGSCPPGIDSEILDIRKIE